MAAEMRAMLDELMGKDRDLSLTEREKGATHWSDSNVCKYFLVKFCPHDLFTNTRADLGTCKYPIHDQKIREVYRTSQRYKTMGYEAMMLRFLEGIVDDMEKKIKKQHERLEHDERYMKAEEEKMNEGRNQRLEDLDKKIDMLLERMSQAGARGNVDEAQQMMREVDFFRQEREKLKTAKIEEPQRKVFLNVPFINEMKHMEVCTTCGAFLVVNDTQTRVDAHLAGKQHVGYTLIRETIKELKELKEKEQQELEEKRAARRAAREQELKGREPSRDGAREGEPAREPGADNRAEGGEPGREEPRRSASRSDADRSNRSRDRDRDRDRDRRRDPREDYRRRDRSRDRGRSSRERRRSRSRSRDRDRGRDRGSYRRSRY